MRRDGSFLHASQLNVSGAPAHLDVSAPALNLSLASSLHQSLSDSSLHLTHRERRDMALGQVARIAPPQQQPQQQQQQP